MAIKLSKFVGRNSIPTDQIAFDRRSAKHLLALILMELFFVLAAFGGMTGKTKEQFVRIV